MPPIDWMALAAVLIPMLADCFGIDLPTPTIEEARERFRNPEIFAVFKLARAARKEAGAPRRDTFAYMKAIRERATALTDEECDELFAEATESEA